LIGGLLALAVLILGVPRFLRSLNTVSTDDAYVNSHVTFVAPRVSGQVMGVLVDDNSRVRKGDVAAKRWFGSVGRASPARGNCRAGHRIT
jgi:multidrug resistance efflux pump